MPYVNLTKQQLIHSFHHNALELAGHITDTYILPSHLLKIHCFTFSTIAVNMLWDVVSTWKAPTPLLFFASTFSHFETRKQFYSILEQEVLPDLQLRFPHRVIHTLLDGLNIHLLNISKKINSYMWFCFLDLMAYCCRLVYLREHNIYSAQGQLQLY
jgi:hypothetical protein